MEFQSKQLVWDDISLNKEDLNYSLGKGYKPEKEILSLITALELEVSQICKPRYGYRIFTLEKIGATWVDTGNCKLHTGPVITPFFDGAEYCALFVATAGDEFERLLQKEKAKGLILNEYLLDALGSAIAEATVRKMCQDIEVEQMSQGYGVSYPYSPGYCGWHVSDQQLLFSQLPEHPCGIVLNASSLMYPIKSVSGILAIGRQVTKQKYGCELCGKKDCYKNRKGN